LTAACTDEAVDEEASVPAILSGIEKSPRMFRIATTALLLSGVDTLGLHCSDALLAFGNYPELAPESFDLVLTNPPFGSLLTRESLASLGEFDLAKTKARVPLEVLGLERSVQFLSPEGRLGIVLPDSILSNRGSRYIRDWLCSHGHVKAVVSLPIETFQPYGASIKTSVLFFQKSALGEVSGRKGKAAVLSLGSLGYDATGRATGDSDIDEGIQYLRTFFDKEGW